METHHPGYIEPSHSSGLGRYDTEEANNADQGADGFSNTEMAFSANYKGMDSDNSLLQPNHCSPEHLRFDISANSTLNQNCSSKQYNEVDYIHGLKGQRHIPVPNSLNQTTIPKDSSTYETIHTHTSLTGIRVTDSNVKAAVDINNLKSTDPAIKNTDPVIHLDEKYHTSVTLSSNLTSLVSSVWNRVEGQGHVCSKAVANDRAGRQQANVHFSDGSLKQYRCGSCSELFPTICALHEHLQDHTEGGSYHYDHAIQTAFPKYDSCCSATQTRKDDLLRQGKRKRYQPSRYQESTSDNNDQMPTLELKTELDEENHVCDDFNTELESTFNVELIHDNVATEAVNDNYESNGDYVPVELKRKKTQLAGKSVRFKLKKGIHKTKRKYRTVKRPRRTEESETKPDADTKHLAEKPEIKPQPYMKSPLKLPDGTKMVCMFCDKMFQYSKGLRRHESLFHAKEMKFACDICNCKFMRMEDAHNHKLRCHIIGKNRKYRKRAKDMAEAGALPITLEKNKLSTAPINCEICGITVPEYKFEVHTRIHTGERPFICEICGKGLISEKKLKRHLLIHSSVRPFCCDMCPRAFVSKYKLKLHVNTHTGTKPFLCNICGAKFNHNSNLSTHTKVVHLGERPHMCDVCPSKFGKKQQLTDHMVSHTSERNMSCGFCGNMFKSEKGLKRHEKIHTQEKKFVCDSCGSAFSRNDNLQRHKLTHAEATSECVLCRRMFKDEEMLSDHQKRTHQDQTGNGVKPEKSRTFDNGEIIPNMSINHTFVCGLCNETFLNEELYYSHIIRFHPMDRTRILTEDPNIDTHFLTGNTESNISMAESHRESRDDSTSMASATSSAIVTVGMTGHETDSFTGIMGRDSAMSREQSAAVMALTSLGHRERGSVLNIPSRGGSHRSLDMSVNALPNSKSNARMAITGQNDQSPLEVSHMSGRQMALAFTGIQSRDSGNPLGLPLASICNEGSNMFSSGNKNTAAAMIMIPGAGVRPESMDVCPAGHIKPIMPSREHATLMPVTSMSIRDPPLMIPLTSVPSALHHYGNRDVIGAQGRYFDNLPGPHN